ncbi:type III glutamate--ammonia ligase [Micrococcus lylae]|uniref:type III glutamate--ammonia ligase n=1 Tax=Micrococcus TaxID=1269 RepID=UPI0008A3E873|nr:MULTISPECIES: type III glutamate--ammonia ligase [Micrococcus]MCT2007053.1 type III glutamate--ammonia ligase [Micrococcus lylae]MCT2070851.1 type III glutamate--ammonia ligase [Micrococcus lylae]OFR87107.1 type III glutamate--ammonia ligase [Micrococcus sp. HMSC067E09]WIK82530.1 type III glutamate--ammonia ligase [Micrococcus lylae]
MTAVAAGPEATDVPKDPAAADRPTLRELAERDSVDYILATFVDMTGRACSKLVPVSAAEELEAGGMGFSGFAAGNIGQGPQDPDLLVLPDPDSWMPLHFLQEGLAMVQCDPHVEGRPWPYAPRVILRNTLARLAARDMTAMVGAELEYFILRRTEDGGIATGDDEDTSPNPCYDARGVTRMFDHLTTVAAAMNELGWDNYANDHEDSAGQFEQNFKYADALTTADRVIAARYIISMIAHREGYVASFMPKPFTERAGSGLHMHLSLWDGGTPLFPDAEDDRGLGLSETAYGFIGGLLEHGPALQVFLAPTVNSYKRANATTTVSGATYAPQMSTYGGNDRTQSIRVPEGNRVELRTGDGAGNPYLMLASALEAGLDGIDRSLDPGDPAEPGGNSAGAKRLPMTLLHAVDALRADETILGCLSGDREIGEYYASLKETEFFTWHNRVSDWEVETYLTQI